MPEEHPAPSKIVSLNESFMRAVAVTKLGSLTLGFAATLLVLLSDLMNESTAVKVLLISVVLMMLVFAFTILVQDREHPGLGSGGIVAFFFAGSALGILVYHWRGDIAEQWLRYKSLGGLSDVVFAALLVFGVIVGIFVVRLWNKEQDDFIKSVTTSLGGAIVPPLLGKTIDVDGGQAFAAYFLGFAVSTSVNVLNCARLIGDYSNKRTLESRSKLSFLYGSDKAEAIDKQFVKNFEEDPVYARRLLVDTVLEYQKSILREFAKRKEAWRKKQDPQKLRCFQLISIQCDKESKDSDLAPQGKAEPEVKKAHHEKNAEHNEKEKLQNEKDEPRDKKLYTAFFREIDNDNPINEDMFRCAVSVKWDDNLEYITAPGSYKKSMPYFGSVAGLSLYVLKTIVMDRDKEKRFRTSEYPEGLCPAKIEQTRGLDEIDFLSYIVIPVASRFGQPQQTRLGILHVDTKLFAATEEEFLRWENPDNQGVYKKTFTPAELTEFAKKLYDQKDDSVKYLEDMRALLVPVLELYLKCRQGSA